MKRFPQQNELKARDEKIKLMNDRQKQWMEERKSSRPNNSQALNHSKAQGIIPHQLPKPKKQNSSVEKKTSNEVLLWTAKNPDAINDGFVVRKPPGKFDGRKSSRSSKSNSTSQPSSSRSLAEYEAAQETRNVTKSKEVTGHLTSTPERAIRNDADDFEILKELSAIRVSTTKSKEKMFDGNENINAYDRYQYSTVDEEERKGNINNDVAISGISKYGMTGQNVNMQRGNNAFAMHCCPLCKTLMNLKSHRPFLIIPCGHNVCAQCQPGQTDCPTCRTRISSSVENSALSHVISEYKKQEEREELARKEEEARKFVEEYDSLKTRCDVLSCKAEIVIETMENITANLVQTKQIMKATKEKKAEIRHKISCLEEELSMCETEYGNYEKQCNELELSYSKEKGSLDMIEDTLDRVQHNKEKVKQLLLGYIPSFKFEDD